MATGLDLLVLGLVSVGLVLFWRRVLSPGIWDDAYISMTAARHLLAGDGLHFHPLIEDYAITTLTWPLLIALGGLVTGDLPLAVHLLSSSAEVLLAVVYGLVALEVTRSRLCALLALVLLISNPVVVLCSHWGMETALYLALMSAAVLCLVRGRGVFCLVLAALAVWTRVDGIAFYAVSLVAVWTGQLSRLPAWRDVRAAWPSVLVVAAYFLFNVTYFGRLLPDSVTAKVAMEITTVDPLRQAWWVTREFLAAFTGRSGVWIRQPTAYVYLTPLFVLGLVACRDLRALRQLALPVLYALGYAAAFIGSARGYAVNFPWYFVPPLLGAYLLVALGVRWATTALGGLWRRHRTVPSGRWALVAGLLGVVAWAALLYPPLRRDAVSLRDSSSCREHAYAAATVWLGQNLAATRERFIAANEIGAVGYHAPPGVGTLDLIGLSRSTAEKALEGLPVIEQYRPAAIVTNIRAWPQSVANAYPGLYRWIYPETACPRPLVVGVRADLMDQGQWGVAELEALLARWTSASRPPLRDPGG